MLIQWEYAVFTVRVPSPSVPAIENIDEWPVSAMQQDALLVEMNRLGSLGWEIFERAHPWLLQPKPGQLFPYNLWAKRPVGASTTPDQHKEAPTGSKDKDR